MGKRIEQQGLVERLRRTAPTVLYRKGVQPRPVNPDGPEAVDRIEQLEAEMARVRAALEPFSKAADFADERMKARYLNTNLPDGTVFGGPINLGNLRTARAALKETQHGR